MDKIRSILSSASGRKVGPPVPPRPNPAAVQKALEKTRHLSNSNGNSTSIHNFPSAVPIAKGRTVIYTSTNSNNNNNEHHIDQQQQQQHQQVNICENKCFDTKFNDSSTGLKVIVKQQNGNTAIASTNNSSMLSSLPATPTPTKSPATRVLEINHKINNNSSNSTCNKELLILHNKSPVPKPRLKTPPLLPKIKPIAPNPPNYHQIISKSLASASSATLQTEYHINSSNNNQQQSQQLKQHQENSSSSYTRLLMQNQISHDDDFNCGIKQKSGKIDQNTIKSNKNIIKTIKREDDDELKEKLLNEIFSGRLVETSNVHLRYNNKGSGSNLKRSSSCDVLNDRNSIIEKSPSQLQLQRVNHQIENGGDQSFSKDRKVVFHEMLISELSEMRRAGNDTNKSNHHNHRLSSAKSCSDLSPSGGNKQMTIIEMRDNVKITNRSNSNNSNSNTTCLISLEDSGVEDEDKAADDCSSSGVGDSWDSAKEMQNR